MKDNNTWEINTVLDEKCGIIREETNKFRETRREYNNYCTALINQMLTALGLGEIVFSKELNRKGRLYPTENLKKPFGAFNIQFFPYKKDGVTPYECPTDNVIFDISGNYTDAINELRRKYTPVEKDDPDA